MSSLLRSISKLFPPGVVIRDGCKDQRVASRLDVDDLSRQICFNREQNRHVMPGNAVLPEHHGTIITRSLQEWVCLLPLDLPFNTVERLLRWQTQCKEMICASEARRLVCAHGGVIREAEAKEIASLMEKESLSEMRAQLVPNNSRRSPLAWPEELSQAVAMALDRGTEFPPEGVKVCDWERVLAARREEQLNLAQLRRLGPEVKPDQIVAATDDVLVKRPEKGRSLSIRTARVATAQGFRYLSGGGEAVLNQLYLLLILCGAHSKRILLLGDGAKWIRNFFTEWLKGFSAKEFVLDWYHLAKKCYEFASMICKGRKAKACLMGRLAPCLWQGKLQDAIAHLEAYRPECRNEDKLDDLIQYLKAQAPYIPNYKERGVPVGSTSVADMPRRPATSSSPDARSTKGCNGVSRRLMAWRLLRRLY